MTSSWKVKSSHPETCLDKKTAQPKDIVEIPKWNTAPPRNLSFSMLVSQHHQNSFSPLFTDSRKTIQSLGCMDNHGRTHFANEDYQKCASRANLKIAEADPAGHFVKISNCSPEKEESTGDHFLKQDVQSQTVAVFRFPPETRMWPSSTTTAEAWYPALCWKRRQGQVVKEEREKFDNIVIPAFSTTKQKEGHKNEQEFTEWKSYEPRLTRQKRQSFIKREKKTSASLFPSLSAWCQSPNSPTHPHFSPVRPLTMGNDGSIVQAVPVSVSKA